MTDVQNWRTEINASDYFGHQKKQLQVADRRPLIRKPSDLVGPGIAASAVRLTDYNDLLATYDGFFSSAPGATNAPTPGDPYAGTVVSDSAYGGVQIFTNITTEDVYQRVFRRNPSDFTILYWGVWTALGGGVPGPPGPAGSGLVDFARAKRTSGDVTVNSTTFVNVDTGLDLVMTASASDVIEVELYAKASVASGANPYAVFDFHTIVSSAPVNSVTSETTASTTVPNSFPGWGRALVTTAGLGGTYFAGKKRYTLQAGDISGGTVTLRLRVFTGQSTVIFANDPMLYVSSTNLGPQL